MRTIVLERSNGFLCSVHARAQTYAQTPDDVERRMRYALRAIQFKLMPSMHTRSGCHCHLMLCVCVCCAAARCCPSVAQTKRKLNKTTKSETNCAVKNRKSLIVTFEHRSLIENLIYIALCTWTITHNMHLDFVLFFLSMPREAWRAWECDCASLHCQSFSSVTISGRIFTCCLRCKLLLFSVFGPDRRRAGYFRGFRFNTIDFEIFAVHAVAFRLQFHFIASR